MKGRVSASVSISRMNAWHRDPISFEATFAVSVMYASSLVGELHASLDPEPALGEEYCAVDGLAILFLVKLTASSSAMMPSAGSM